MKKLNDKQALAWLKNGQHISPPGIPAGSRAKWAAGKIYLAIPGADEVDVYDTRNKFRECEESVAVADSPFNPDWVAPVFIPDTMTEETKLITTQRGFDAIFEMDRGFVGTPDYMGLAFFWHYDYRYPLRDATAAERVRVHAAFLANDLPLDGSSEAHHRVMCAAIESLVAENERK